jgi:hypothetical protein
VLTNHFDSLDAVGNAVFGSFVHIQVGWDTFLLFFHNAIFEHERGNAFILKPARDIAALQIDGQRYERPAGSDDDAGSRGFASFWKVNRQSRGDDVKDNGSGRSVIDCFFLLGPMLGSRSYARPEVQCLCLRVSGTSHEKGETDCSQRAQSGLPHFLS